MKADLMKILAGMGLSKDTIADCDRFFEGEIRLEQVRELTVIELHKQPEAVQAGVRSGFQALLRSDRPISCLGETGRCPAGWMEQSGSGIWKRVKSFHG